MKTAGKLSGDDFVKNKSKKELSDFVFILPAIVFIIIFTYYPITQLIKISFSDWNLLSDSYSFVGFDNYKWFVDGAGAKYLWNSVKVTFVYSLCEMFLTVFGGLVLALLMNSAAKVFKFFQTIVFMPRYISMSCAAVIFLWMLNTDNGVLNQIINLFGVDSINWLGDKFTAFLSIVAVSAWRNVGYGMMMCLSTISAIPKDFYEAARLDNASRRRVFFNITLPQIMPTLEFLTLTSFLSSIKSFQTIDIMTGGGPMRSTETIVYLIYRYALVDFRMNRAATVAVVLFFVLIFITSIVIIISKKLRKVYGA